MGNVKAQALVKSKSEISLCYPPLGVWQCEEPGLGWMMAYGAKQAVFFPN